MHRGTLVRVEGARTMGAMTSRSVLVLVGVLGIGATWLVLELRRGEGPRSSASETSIAEAASDEPAALAEPELPVEATADAGSKREETVSPRMDRSSANAWLAIRVRARETGQVLPDIHVLLHELPADFGPPYVRGAPDDPPGLAFSSGPSGIRCSCPATDVQGRVTLEAPPGVARVLTLNALSSVHARRESFSVPPLAPGERRELELELTTRDDLRWYGRVLDDATGAPLAGVRASWVAGAPVGVRGCAASPADGGLVIAFA